MGIITVTSAMASPSLPFPSFVAADDDDLKTPDQPTPSAINMTIIGGLVCAARDKLDDVRR